MISSSIIIPSLYINAKPSYSLQHMKSYNKIFSCIKNVKNITQSNMSTVSKNSRPVARKVAAKSASEGMGDVSVWRSIGGSQLRNFDPFLFLDEGLSESGNFTEPDHPHRGFEIASYTMEGNVVHEDFTGHRGTVNSGEFQWMTAGRGVVHSGYGAAGRMWCLQLWVNLPSQYKMIQPNFLELKVEDIPEPEKDGVKVRVIAGEAFGVKMPSYTKTPTMFLDFTLNPGAYLEQPIPTSWNAFVYILDGEGIFGDEKSSSIKPHNILLLGSGDGVEAWNKSSKPLRFVLVAGEPIGEPVASYGPFVMNTQEEIEQCFRDYRSHKNGFENASTWISESSRRLGHM